jgi:hypothetical protein
MSSVAEDKDELSRESNAEEEDDPDSVVHVAKVPSLASDDFLSYQAHEAASKGALWRKSKLQPFKKS